MPDQKRKFPSKACFCAVLTAWLVVAVIVFLITSLLYLGPLIQVLRFRPVNCLVESTFYTTQFVCTCGYNCKSSYPCALIHVSLNASDGELWTLALYKDEMQQESVISLDQDKQEWCSLKVCKNVTLLNHRIIDDFTFKYGQRGTWLSCSYDPWDIKAGAVLHTTPITMSFFHALFWPFLCIVICVTLCIIFCRKCRQDSGKKSSGETNKDPEVAVQLTTVDDQTISTAPVDTSRQSPRPTGINEIPDKTHAKRWGHFFKTKSSKACEKAKKKKHRKPRAFLS